MTVILNKDGKPLASAVRQKAQLMAVTNQARAYQAAGFGHPTTRNWNAPAISGAAAASQSREVLTSRTRDMVRNDSNMAAGLDKKVNNVVGGGLRLDADPNYDVLGIDAETGEAITEKIEALWEEFSNDQGCWVDAERNGSLADLLIVLTHHLETEGEAFVVLPWRENVSPVGFQTCMQIVHPARCSNPMGRMDSDTLREGVSLDAMGAAQGYWFRRAHPGDRFMRGVDQFQWDYFERDHQDGRPYVLHAFERNEAGLYRSISRLWAVLRKQMQGEQYFDTELQAAQLNATAALFIETPLDKFEAIEAMSPQGLADTAADNAEYHNLNPVQMSGAQINVLGMGEKAHLTKPEHPNAAFDPFMKNVLRALASIIGITYEQLTMDWSEVNYSSARAAILEVAKGFRVVLGRIKQKLLKPFYWAWLQEVFDKDLIELPVGALSFDDAPEAWSRHEWIGAGRGYVEPLKEVQAAGMRIVLGLSTMKKECAEQGEDWRKLIKQTVREVRLMRRAAEAEGLDPDKVWHPAYSGVPSASTLAKSVVENASDAEDDSGVSAKRGRKSASGVPLVGSRFKAA